MCYCFFKNDFRKPRTDRFALLTALFVYKGFGRVILVPKGGHTDKYLISIAKDLFIYLFGGVEGVEGGIKLDSD